VSYDGSPSMTTVRPRNAEPTSVNSLGRNFWKGSRKSHDGQKSETNRECGGAVDMLRRRDASPGAAK